MRRALTFSVAASLLACGIVGPDRVVGLIDSTDDFSVPDSVRAGEPFTVTLLTGGGGCHEMGDTDVSVQGNTAIIVPYDRLHDAVVCTSELNHFDHSVAISFPSPGEARVILRAAYLISGAALELTETVEVY